MKLYQQKEWLEKQVLDDKTTEDISKDQNVDRSTISKWIRRHGITYKIKRKTFKLYCFDCRKMYLSKGRKKSKDGRYRCRTCQSKLMNSKAINRITKRKVYSKRYRDKKREWGLKNLYGLTLEDFNEFEMEQNGRCKICLKEEKLVVDHCHDSGLIRGLLCHKCNLALGLFDDNVETLQRAIDYLI